MILNLTRSIQQLTHILKKIMTRSGSKADFIFNDYDENGTEVVSIVFEMKNESDTTATKKKNEDFFKELDKDRGEKGCGTRFCIALRVNELYNRYRGCLSQISEDVRD